MPDLQNPKARRLLGQRRGRPFELLAGVTGEPDVDEAVAHAQHHRIVVPDSLSFPLRRRRMHRLDDDVAKIEARARENGPPRRRGVHCSQAQAAPLRIGRNGHAFPDFCRRQVPQDRWNSPDVIAIAVRHREPVESSHSERPKRWSHDATADVEWSRCAAGIDQQRPAVSAFERGPTHPVRRRPSSIAAVGDRPRARLTGCRRR